jgi:hypothetical protein
MRPGESEGLWSGPLETIDCLVESTAAEELIG